MEQKRKNIIFQWSAIILGNIILVLTSLLAKYGENLGPAIGAPLIIAYSVLTIGTIVGLFLLRQYWVNKN